MVNDRDEILYQAEYPSLLDYPAPGKILAGPLQLAEQRDQILKQALALEKQGGGVLAIPFSKWFETTVLLLLGLLRAQLRKKKKNVYLYRTLLEPYFSWDKLSDFRGYLLVHHLPRLPALLELLQNNPNPGRVVIAAGFREEWERLTITLPCRFYSIPPEAAAPGQENESEMEDDLKQVLSEQWNQYKQLPADDQKIYRLVSLFNAWGIPLPFRLLTRALSGDEDEISLAIENAQEKNLLFWVELEDPPALLVTTQSPPLALAMLERLTAEGLAKDEFSTLCTALLKRIDPAEKEERYVLLKFFRSILTASYLWPHIQKLLDTNLSCRRWLNGLFESFRGQIDEVWKSGDTVEQLLWAIILEELRLFEQSQRVLEWGLQHAPFNKFLLQRRARLQGVRAQSNSYYLRAAEEAFSETARLSPANPYVWQAWGVMEAELGRIRKARDLFERALEAAAASGQPAEQVYTLAAFANLEIEAGRPKSAALLLDRAAPLAPRNPYIPHLRGKMAFYQGAYSQAAAWFAETARIDPMNVPARHSLGYMAFKRGHWVKALLAFQDVLAIYPENVPNLQALAELWMEKGNFAREERNYPEAARCYEHAQKYLQFLSDIEPENLYGLTAQGVHLCGMAKIYLEQNQLENAAKAMQEAETALQAVLKRKPDNKFALHALGELKMLAGDMASAEAQFSRILNEERNNVPALLSLAQLHYTKASEEAAQQYLEQAERILKTAESSFQDPEKGEYPLSRHELIRAYNTRAEIELKAGRANNALAFAEAAALHDQENAYTLRCLARVYEEMGENEKARAHWEKAQRSAESL